MSYFSQPHVDRAIGFIKHLTHTKGKWATQRFELLPWQKNEIITPLYGTLRDGTAFRQYEMVYVEMPKKNGKSELGAAIALKSLIADGEPGAEVYSCACDRAQASIVFNVAAQMVRQSDLLSPQCKIINSQKKIIVRKTGAVYTACSAEAYNKHGLNVSCVIFDELHSQPNRELWDVMTVGSGDARDQPIYFAITTAGYDRKSICWEVREHARQVIEGKVPDPTLLPVIYSAPPEADWEDRKVWIQVNPSTITEDNPDGILPIEKIEKAYRKAKQTPAQENTFRRLRLNQWMTQHTRFIRMKDWHHGDDPVDLEAIGKRPGYVGLDLASTTDITAMVAVFSPETPEGIYDVLPYFWVPEDTIKQRSEEDRVRYDIWSKDGHLFSTPGNRCNYAAIEKHFLEILLEKFNIRELAYDPYNADYLVSRIADAGFDEDKLVPFRQGYPSMSPACKGVEMHVLGKQLRHGNHPVLTWMADNIVATENPQGDIKFDKSKSTERIDGMVALAMALDRAIRNIQEAPEPYNLHGIRTLG